MPTHELLLGDCQIRLPALTPFTPASGIDTKSGLTTPFIEGIISQKALAHETGEMVRKAHLHPHLTSCELKSRYLCASDRVESRRWHLLWLVSKNGQSSKQPKPLDSYQIRVDYPLYRRDNIAKGARSRDWRNGQKSTSPPPPDKL
jgi:hypothetical protein